MKNKDMPERIWAYKERRCIVTDRKTGDHFYEVNGKWESQKEVGTEYIRKDPDTIVLSRAELEGLKNKSLNWNMDGSDSGKVFYLYCRPHVSPPHNTRFEEIFGGEG